MIRFFKDLYVTFFAIGFKLRAPQQLGGGWGPDVDAGKGVLLIWFIEFLILKGIQPYVEVLVGARFFFDSSLWGRAAITLALYLPNYYILVTRGHGIRFERDFIHLQKSRKILLLVSCAVLLLATIAFTMHSASVRRPSIGMDKP